MIHLICHFLACLSPNRCNLKNPHVLSEVIKLIAVSLSLLFITRAPTLGYVWVCLASVQQEPTGGLPLPGRGSEVGSKVTKSISCELLRASSVVTHHGSQARRDALPPPFFCFLPSFPCVGFLFAPSHENTPILARSHTLYVLYNAHA